MSRARVATAHLDPVRFSASIRLTKGEAFDACQALADADRFLLRAGHHEAAGALGVLFELLEERLTAS
ncbi:MAG: hypothetical protein ACRDYE_14980 [Acidimicrobiales bacterium]